MVTIKKLTNQTDKRLIKDCIQYLHDGNAIIYPTDTAYGLGVEYSNLYALEKISKLKNRPPEKQYSVIAPSFDWMKSMLEISEQQDKILRTNLPGEFTFILKTKYSNKTLGVRIPKHPFIQMLARTYGEPITATSANSSGSNTPYSIKDLEKDILKNTFQSSFNILVIDGGHIKGEKQSTIVDLTKNPPEIVREGSGKFLSQV